MELATSSETRNKSMKIIPKSNQGFTLIELMVAVGIFSIVSLMAISIFLTALQAQRKISALQTVQEHGRYLMEIMSKEIRMSQINSSDGKISFLNIINSKPESENVIYSFDNDQLLRGIGEIAEVLNSNQVKINGSFYVQKSGSQPRVTIVMAIESSGNKPEQQVKINLETTVSSRAYE